MIYKTIGTTNQSQSTITLNLESTAIFLTVLLTITGLITFFWKAVSSFNKIASDIRDIREDLANHANAEGHEKLLLQTKGMQVQLSIFDKQFAVHLENYNNRTEAVNMIVKQLNEKIDNKGERLEKMINECEDEVKDVQKYLQKREDFKIREDVK